MKLFRNDYMYAGISFRPNHFWIGLQHDIIDSVHRLTISFLPTCLFVFLWASEESDE